MKAASLDIPSRDLGKPSLRPLASKLIDRLEAIERKLTPPGQPPPNLLTERMLLEQLDGRTGDAVAMERQRVLQRALDEVYFRPFIAAGKAMYVGAVTEVFNALAPVMRFPAGAATAATIVTPTRALWPRCRPRMEVIYTSAVGSTNLFSLRFTVRQFGAGGTTSPSALTVDWTAPGPAVANDVLATSAVITSGTLWSSPFGATRVSLTRLGPDGNANDLDVLLAVVTFEELA